MPVTGQVGIAEIFLAETVGMVAVGIVPVIIFFVFIFPAAAWVHIFVLLPGEGGDIPRR